MEIKIFVSYNHTDSGYLADDSLIGYLKGLEREGVSFWWDEALVTGDNWDDEIKDRIQESHIALVLVSQWFLDSAYCTEVEILEFLRQCQRKGLVIFPVILSACEWKEHEWLRTRQFLPRGKETIEEHYSDPGRRKRLFWQIRKDLKQQIERIRQSNNRRNDTNAPVPETIKPPTTRESIRKNGYKAYELPLMEEKKVGTGWLMPTPDLRDLTVNNERVVALKKRLHIPRKPKANLLPGSADLRSWCPNIRDQGSLDSSTAHVVLAMIEYFERRAFGRYVNLSRLFLYKEARRLMNLTGDSGASLRATLQAIRLFGVPAEEDYPYTDKVPDFDREPPAYVYAKAYNYGAAIYFCHDPMHMNTSPDSVLGSVKTFLAAGIPSILGLFIFPSFGRSNIRGGIPFPCPAEGSSHQHAVLAVGYDDNKRIKNLACNKITLGALLIQNAWGDIWGDRGYGWLPYEYVLKKQALDFWSMLQFEWVDTGNFGI